VVLIAFVDVVVVWVCGDSVGFSWKETLPTS
jgi:hypothetical protein